MNCPACGFENPEGIKFCGHCAEPLLSPSICVGCGFENPRGFRFCGECAKPLGPKGRLGTPERTPRDYTPKHLAEKILQDKSALEGERKQVTVLFADVKGSMDLAEQVDPEEWHRILNRFFEILTDGVHRFEGTVNQYTGDGIMALFGAPIAHEDHAQRACWAALHLRDELRSYADELRRRRGLNFSVRMGLHSGEVVVGKIGDDLRMDYTAQGHTVGLAARMQEIAEARSIYLTGATAALVSGYFELRDLREFELKGVRGPVHVYELQRAGRLRTRLDLSRARGFSKFVGRAAELSTLQSAFERTLEGNGHVLGVVGEAGIGKSRLCLEFVERCRADGVEALESHCPPHGKTVPYLPLLQLLRGLFDISESDRGHEIRRKIAGELMLLDEGLREVMPLVCDFIGAPDPKRSVSAQDPEERQRQLFAFFRRLVWARSERQPTVLLIDDLHWIDPGSDAFLAQLVEAAGGTRTLVLVNFRPEYTAEWMGRSDYQQIALRALGARATEELLADLLGNDRSVGALRTLIRERTTGNPFFIEEIVQSLAESGSLEGTRGAYQLLQSVSELKIPTTVQPLLASRLDRLPELEKQVLRAAAVIGQEFSEPILEAVAELPAIELREALSSLKGAEFVYERTLYPVAEYAFKHPLTHDVAYSSQLSDRRGRLHSAVAQALEEQGAEDQDAALVAQHWEASGDALRAARWYRRAARWAVPRDPEDAARRWRTVWVLAEEIADPNERSALRLDAALGIFALVSLVPLPAAEARTLFEEGQALARELGNRPAEARLLFGRANWILESGGLDEFRDHLRQMESILDGTREAASLYCLRAFAGVGAFFSGETSEALRFLGEATEIARANPGLLEDPFVRRQYFFQQFNQAVTLARAGQLSAAAAQLEAAREQARSYGDCGQEYMGCYYAAFQAWYRGDASEALRHAREQAELGGQLGLLGDSRARITLGTAHVVAENWSEAVSCLEEGLRLGRETRLLNQLEAVNLANLAQAYLGLGDWDRARAVAEQAIATAQARGNRPYALYGSVVLARVLMQAEGRSALREIEEAIEQATRLLAETGTRIFEPAICVERGRLAGLMGDSDTRERELRNAHRLYTEMGATGHSERLARELPL